MTKQRATAFVLIAAISFSHYQNRCLAATTVATLVEPLRECYVRRTGAADWDAATTNKLSSGISVGDRLRTLEHGEAAVQLGDSSIVHFDELSTVDFLPPHSSAASSRLNLEQGLFYMLHRNSPGSIEAESGAVNAAVEGTDFSMSVDRDGIVTITLIDGKVRMSNPQGSIELTNMEKGVARPGQAPTKTSVIEAANSVQWSLYYPGVLDPAELTLPASYSTSFAAYRNGDLVKALSLIPTNNAPNSADERIYQAATVLSGGEVEQCQKLIALDPSNSLSQALRMVIAAVKDETLSNATPGSSASQLIGYSYYAQSRHDLEGALKAAQAAAVKSPGFAFAWERVADLQFSFGKTAAAEKALDKSLALAPSNAQAHALKGFILAADNRVKAAIGEFNIAIGLDGKLANAWLGRGLCYIKRGDIRTGFQNLLTAAVLEPNRSLLHSYLGKAFANGGEESRAEAELRLARYWDPNDPTPWLYLALLEQQENKINPAIIDMEKAQAENDNRSVFRSSLLLDQDRAVAGANLASIYRDAGMTDVSVREAARAVVDDYSDDSAHLFLANSYYSLLDPTQFNLRYDTAWFNELLLANILAPVGAGQLSQQVSQQDYSKLFEADGLSLADSTDVRTDGMVHQTASQFGTYGNTGYAVDLDYHHNYGVRVNNELDNLNLDGTIKQQLSPQDTVLLLVQYENYHSGDNFQYYYQTNARPYYEFAEQQQPELVGAWHHEWAPGIQTLLLLGRLVDNQEFSDKAAPQYLFFENSHGAADAVNTADRFDVNYAEQFAIYSAELNQICQWDRVTLVAGGRYQSGEFQTQDTFSNPSANYAALFNSKPYVGAATNLFQRVTAYSYLTVEPFDHLWLTGGVAADEERFPDTFRNPPVTAGDDSRSQIGPKAALVWNPIPETTFRGIYAQSLGGVSIDESYRLEPTELAGFPQAFRSLISESVVGSQSAPTFDTLGGALDIKLREGTYLGFQVERLTSEVTQGVGDFVLPDGATPAVVSSTPEQLNYVEHDGSVTLNQIIGEGFVFGAAYRLTQSDLRQSLSDIPASVVPSLDEKATLQEASSYLLFNHSSGFYAKVELNWYGQNNSGWTPAEPNVSFFQENIFAGYFLLHRRAALQLGILNLGGHNYDLNPLTVYQELPRKRVFEAKLNFIF